MLGWYGLGCGKICESSSIPWRLWARPWRGLGLGAMGVGSDAGCLVDERLHGNHHGLHGLLGRCGGRGFGGAGGAGIVLHCSAGGGGGLSF